MKTTEASPGQVVDGPLELERAVSAVADSPRRCGMASCASGLPGRPYPEGWRCDRCCPSAVAGEQHPDEIAARARAQREAHRAVQIAARAA